MSPAKKIIAESYNDGVKNGRLCNIFVITKMSIVIRSCGFLLFRRHPSWILAIFKM